MILSHGKLWDSKEQEKILDGLEKELCKTLSAPAPDPEIVISACDALGKKALSGDYDHLLQGLGLENGEEQVARAAALLSRESLEYRMKAELGPNWGKPVSLSPPGEGKTFEKRLVPLGVLLHIAAGNVEGLPAYSVAEGLLTGNINLLKLPSADNGLSIALLQELTRLAPELMEYIYVFDTPSEDVSALKKMADLSDGVAVWGGDGAVSALRAMAKPGTRLIEWGHKLGFSYLVPGAWNSRDLQGLADHIMETKQLLCSSCQVIYLDTEDGRVLEDFCREFLPFMEEAAQRFPLRDMGLRAELSLKRYTSKLEEQAYSKRGREEKGLFPGNGCSLRIKEDSVLELSPLFGECLVKPLPRKRLLSVLREKKEYLQTAGLLCAPEEREELVALLLRCGVVKVCLPRDMSRPAACDGHDGEAPLRRYLRVADVYPGS